MKRILPILVVLLFAAAGHAFSVEVPATTVNVPTLGSYDYPIVLSSNTTEMVSVNLINSNTWTSISANTVQLSPGNDQSVVITFEPPRDSDNLYAYPITLSIESLTTQQAYKQQIYVTVFKGEIIAIEKIGVSGKLIPTNTMLINVSVKNYKDVSSNQVTLDAAVYDGPSTDSRKIFEFTKVIDNINPDERVSVAMPYTLPRYARAGTYMITANLTSGGDYNGSIQTFKVDSASIPLVTESKTSLLFGYSRQMTVTNDGNEPAYAVTIQEPVTSLEGYFFSGDTPTEMRPDGYSWIVSSVAPGQTVTLGYKIDFTPLIEFIIALVAAFWVIFFKMRTLRVKKYIIQKKELQEGEEFTVGIEIKNATGRKLDATVRDFVPPVFEIKDAQSPAPSRKKTPAGVELTWHLKDVHRKDERLLSYKIVPIFGVRGQIRLPRARASFKKGNTETENKSTYALIGINTEKNQLKKKKEDR